MTPTDDLISQDAEPDFVGLRAYHEARALSAERRAREMTAELPSEQRDLLALKGITKC